MGTLGFTTAFGTGLSTVGTPVTTTSANGIKKGGIGAGATLASSLCLTISEATLFPAIHEHIVAQAEQVDTASMLIESMSLEELRELSNLLTEKEETLEQPTQYVKR